MLQFCVHTTAGSGRGKDLGTPTINLDLRDIPQQLEEGIYACYVTLDEELDRRAAVLHHGPRPVFHDKQSCEVHLLDVDLPSPPQKITVEVVSRLREIRDFPSEEALKEQISADIEAARGILGK